MKYVAFMSYSHAADPEIAPAIQRALYGLAKPWYRLRALRVFRDKTSLSANPALWPAIEQALADAEFFILLASPLAVQSPWVQREVEWWLTHRSVDRLLIVLTDGALVWDGARGDLDWSRSDGVPTQLQGRLAGEPLYVDLRWAKGEPPLTIRDPRFRSAMLDLAATLHGRPKDDLDGQDIREYRRTRLLVSAGVLAVLVLALATAWQWRVRVRQTDIATRALEAARISDDATNRARGDARTAEEAKEQERRRVTARQLAADAELLVGESPARVQTSVLLALESIHRHHFFENERLIRTGLALMPEAGPRFAGHEGGLAGVVASPNGRQIVTAGLDGTSRIWDLSSGRQTALLKHSDSVSVKAVAVSRNGKFVATGGGDKRVQLWNASSGSPLATAKGLLWSISALAFHPQRDQLLIADERGVVQVSSVPSGARARHLRRHDSGVHAVAFAPTGDYAATASADGTARIWDARSWPEEPVAVLRHADDVIAVAFSADGNMVATAGADSVAQIWKVPSGELVARLPHGDAVRAVAFTPDGQLVTGSADGAARVWTVSPTREIARLQHQDDVIAVAVSPDGRRFVTGSTDMTARVWDIGAVEISRLSHENAVTGVAFSRDGQLVITSSLDGTARVWRPVPGNTGIRLPHQGPVHWATFSADTTKVATASADKTARVWTTNGKEQLRLTHPDVVHAVAFSPDQRRVATAGAGPNAVIWNADTGKPVVDLTHGESVSAIAFSLDSRYLATASLDRTARLWDAASGRALATWTHAGSVYSVTFSPDSRYVATVSLDANATIRVWDVQSRQEASSIKESFDEYWTNHPPRSLQYRWGDLKADDARYALAFSPDSRLIATASLGHTARVWRATNGRDVARLVHAGRVISVAFSPDGSRVVTGSEDHTARVWTTETGAEIARMTHRDPVNAVAFSHDGQRVASASSDNSVRIWEAATGRQLTRFDQTERTVAIAFSPDGRYLSIAGGDSVTLHALSREELIRQACERLRPNTLTENEWKPYISERDPYNPVCRASTVSGTASLRR